MKYKIDCTLGGCSKYVLSRKKSIFSSWEKVDWSNDIKALIETCISLKYLPIIFNSNQIPSIQVTSISDLDPVFKELLEDLEKREEIIDKR